MSGSTLDATGIAYRQDHGLTPAGFADLLHRAGLDARRPVDDYPHIGFERHAQAWMVRDAGHCRDAR